MNETQFILKNNSTGLFKAEKGWTTSYKYARLFSHSEALNKIGKLGSNVIAVDAETYSPDNPEFNLKIMEAGL